MGHHFKGLFAAVNSWIDTLLRTTAVKFAEALVCSNLLSPERGTVKLSQMSARFPCFHTGSVSIFYDKMNVAKIVEK